jgi:hypothetical protein
MKSGQKKMIKRMTRHENHGKAVWRYIELQKKYDSPNFLDRLTTISTLIVQPFGHVLFWIMFFGFPSLYTYFGGELKLSWFQIVFYVVSSLHVFWECLSEWMCVLEYHQLSTTLMIWKLLTVCLRLPTIAIHSKDKNHQLFKWAAGMSLLFNDI